MWDLAVREGRYSQADSLLRRKFTPDKLPLMDRALTATMRRDTIARAQLLDEVRKQRTGFPYAPEAIALYAGDLATADEFARAALASPRPPALLASVHQIRARLALAQGQWKAARSELVAAERSIPSARRLQALSATWPFLAVPDSEVVALRRDIEAWDPRAEAPEASPGLASTLQPQLRLYLLGLLSSRLGDASQALRRAGELERSDHPTEADALIRDLARTIRADVDLRRGRVAEALKTLEPVKGEMPPELLTDPFFAEEQARFIRSELLYQLRRDEEAIQWLSNGFQGTPNELMYLAPVNLRQAELYERLGDRQQAVDHYSRFIRLWKGCDPELRPAVDRAKARIASLVGER